MFTLWKKLNLMRKNNSKYINAYVVEREIEMMKDRKYKGKTSAFDEGQKEIFKIL